MGCQLGQWFGILASAVRIDAVIHFRKEADMSNMRVPLVLRHLSSRTRTGNTATCRSAA